MDRSFSILDWNPRGLNAKARRLAVQSLVDQTRCSILCLQETKITAFSPEALRETLGPTLDGSAVLPAWVLSLLPCACAFAGLCRPNAEEYRCNHGFASVRAWGENRLL